MSSILGRNQALIPPFSLFHEPPYVPGSHGIGLPKAGEETVVCIAPGDATLINENWPERLLSIHRGEPHAALAPDDHYPNQVLARDNQLFSLEENDSRAEVLASFWQTRGFTQEHLIEAWREYLAGFDPKRSPKWVGVVTAGVNRGETFFRAKKTQPVIVRGVVDLRFQTSEGPAGLEHGMVIVVHPDDPSNVWAIRAEKFSQRYNLTTLDSGLVIPE